MENKDKEKPEIYTFLHPQSDPTPVQLPPDIVNGLIGNGEKVEIVAPRQSGETHFALQMGLAVSCGLPFCGLATKKQKVLYVDLHGNEWGELFFSRMKKIFAEHYALNADGLNNIKRLPIDCSKVKDITALVNRIMPHVLDGYSLVIIDPIGKVVDIDDFNEWVHHVTFEFNSKLTRDDRTTVVCVHYTPKTWQCGDIRGEINVAGHDVQERCFDTNINLCDLDIPEGTLFQNGLPLNTQGFEIESMSRYHEDNEIRVIFKDEFFELDENGILDDCDFVKKTKHKKSSWID